MSLTGLPDGEQSTVERRSAMEAQLSTLAEALIRKARRAVSDRGDIERRMLRDLAQLSVDHRESSNDDAPGSKVRFNISRSKRNAAAARLSDLLFPLDTRNFGVIPTPVPELSAAASAAGDTDIDPADGAEYDPADVARAALDEAAERAEAMEDEIADQLTECRYRGVARDVITEMCSFGTGIVKGPVNSTRVRKRWEQVEGGEYALSVEEDLRPRAEHVSVWNFFPCLKAGTSRVEDCAYIFERRRLARKELSRLRKLPGYLSPAIDLALKADPSEHRIASDALDALREQAGISVSDRDDSAIEIWEYHGTISRGDMGAGLELGNMELDDEADHDRIDEEDDRDEIEAIVEIANGQVIRIAVNPMETEERPYHVSCWSPSESSVFGYGVPALIRDPQRVIDSSWRMQMDNGGLSVGPQVVIDRERIRPADGDWELAPRKLWFTERDLNSQQGGIANAFATFNVDSHQPELGAIMATAREMVDQEVGLPMLGQGEQGQATGTVRGMAMLMNAGNIVLRQAVKFWDDNITTPLITGFYNWNMQNSPNGDIKGDWEVDARGSSVLLTREVQADTLMGLLNLAQSTGLAELTHFDELYRRALESMDVEHRGLIKTKQELAAAAEAQPDEGEGGSPADMARVQAAQIQAQSALEIAKIKAQVDLQVAQSRIGSDEYYAIARLALDRETTVADMQTRLGIEQARLEGARDRSASEDRRVAAREANKQAEMALKRNMGTGI